ncbi:MAG: protein translocase subunit SecD, partial [Pseudonocardiales bacterium]
MAVPSGQLQVGRYFLALAAIVALIYGLVFFTGSTRTPKLGLDLQGGTTVTLKAATTNGKPPSKESLSQARTIIERRVNGSGVAEAEVLTQGKDQLVVSVPGRQKIVQLTSTAQLRFRRVIQAQANTAPAVTPSPGGSPSASPKAPVVGGASPTPSKKRVLTSALVAPTPTPTPTTATSPKPGASSSAAPTDAVLTTLLSRPAETLFADPRMTCQVLALRPSGAVEDAKKKQVACDTANQNKYLLDVAKVLGTDVSGADYQVDSTSGQWKVTVNFKNKGQGRWTDLTREAFNATPPTNRVAIVLDDSVISAPDILGVITGPADISGQFSQSEAKSLANQLKYGALPLHFDVLTNDAVSPTLGTDQLKAGLLAGGIGLALVALYSLLYYRLLGFVTIISLALSGVITYGLIVLLGRQIGFTLTLAGIAGFIVAVGITADSFVVFFERIKDEVKDGRSVRSA